MASSTPVPFLPPPPGETSNFIDPPSRAPEVHVAAATCLPLILIFSLLRLYSKLTIKTKKTWDDLAFVLGLIAGISYISLLVATIDTSSFGLHDWDINVSSFNGSSILITVTNLYLYGPFVWLIKLTLFALYLEIFGVLPWLKYLAIMGITFTGLFYLTVTVSFIIECSPRNGSSQTAWIAAFESNRCLRPEKTLSVVVGVGNVLSDFYLILLPLPAVWGLQIPVRKKLAISSMFLTGSIACAASIVSLAFRVKYTASTDQTWNVVPAITSSIVEITAGIMVCCMPSAAAVYKSIQPRVAAFLSTHSHNESKINRSPVNHRYFTLQPAQSRTHEDTNAAGGKDGFHTTERSREEQWHQEADPNAYPLRDLPRS